MDWCSGKVRAWKNPELSVDHHDYRPEQARKEGWYLIQEADGRVVIAAFGEPALARGGRSGLIENDPGAIAFVEGRAAAGDISAQSAVRIIEEWAHQPVCI